jgi:hypothetical protein
MKKHTLKPKEEPPILSLIQEIKDGKLNPVTLNKDSRQACVEVFLAEGYNIPAIAQILKKSDRTIQRDIDEIREKNALTPDMYLAKKIIGDFYFYLSVHREHLMRLARTKDASVSERAQAEYYAHRIGVERIEKLQTLGYLPIRPQQVVGDIFWHNDEKSILEKLQNLKAEAVEFESYIDKDNPAQEFPIIKKIIEKIEISAQEKKEEDSHE